jgi:CRP/FNR family cyclic AMP-dependent transcriptional regulator
MTQPTAAELAAVPLLASLTRRQLEAAAALFTVRDFARNAIVETEGERPDFFNLVLSGRVQALWRDDKGHELRLGIDGPGDHFADVTLGGEPGLVSRVAITDLRVASVPINDLRSLMKRHPQMTLILLTDVVARLRRMVARAKTLTMEDVYTRVVKLLLDSSAEVGGKLVADKLTHAEIGQRVGATREMVGRVLRELARGGYIRTERGRMTVLRKPPARW